MAETGPRRLEEITGINLDGQSLKAPHKEGAGTLKNRSPSPFLESRLVFREKFLGRRGRRVRPTVSATGPESGAFDDLDGKPSPPGTAVRDEAVAGWSQAGQVSPIEDQVVHHALDRGLAVGRRHRREPMQHRAQGAASSPANPASSRVSSSEALRPRIRASSTTYCSPPSRLSFGATRGTLIGNPAATKSVSSRRTS